MFRKILLKLLLLAFSIFIIAIFLYWWMSYEPMKIIIKNGRNETINVSIFLLTLNKEEIYNGSFTLEGNDSITLKNVTYWAGVYYLKVKIGEIEKKKRIKYGKYYEIIEITINKEIEIKNSKSL